MSFTCKIISLALTLVFALSLQVWGVDTSVSCLGRLVPGQEVLLIEVPYFMQEPSVINELLVKEGDRVKKDQVLARTNHAELASAMVKEAQATLNVSQKTLELVSAGAEPTVIAAQKAQFESSQADAQLEDDLYHRRIELAKEKAISQEEMDSARLRAEASHSLAEQAQKTLLSLSTVQKEKIALAEAEVTEAQASLDRVKAMFELTEIRSPLDGMVLHLYAHPGEKAERDGLLELGDVDHMEVEAEVYVSDIRHVAVGQKASIQSEAFDGTLTATVKSIDPMVRPNRYVDVNPKSVRENRVVLVRLAIDAPAAVALLTGAEVSVVINP